MSSDLAEFLLARIADDEKDVLPRADHRKRCESGGWSRTRRLAECESKRRIIAWLTDDTVICEVADPVLRLLALPYAGHPGYRDEWRV